MNQVSHNKPRLSFFVLLARSYHVIYKFGGEATLFHRDLLDFLVCLPFFFLLFCLFFMLESTLHDSMIPRVQNHKGDPLKATQILHKKIICTFAVDQVFDYFHCYFS